MLYHGLASSFGAVGLLLSEGIWIYAVAVLKLISVRNVNKMTMDVVLLF